MIVYQVLTQDNVPIACFFTPEGAADWIFSDDANWAWKNNNILSIAPARIDL